MAEETSKASHFEPLSATWRFFAAPQSLLVLMGLAALALVLGTWIPQVPPQTSGDPHAWLAMQTGLLGKGNGLIQALGLYDLYHSFGFRLLLALTGLALFVRAVDSLELAWRTTVRTVWTPASLAAWESHSPRIGLLSLSSVEDTTGQIADFLRGQGFRLIDLTDSPSPHLIAARRQGILWVRALVYGALLASFVGLAIVGSLGWRSEDWQPVPGEARSVGHNLPYALRLDAFDIETGDNGQWLDYQSQVTWLEGDTELQRGVLGVGRPMTFHGVAVRQVGFVPVVKMKGWDAGGWPLALETSESLLSVAGEAEVRFASLKDQPTVLIADHDLFLALTFEPLCSEGMPVLYLDRIGERGSERQRLAAFSESGTVAVNGLRLEVDLAYVPVLRADRFPAIGLVVAGMALTVLALSVVWILPPSLLWIALGHGKQNETEVRVWTLGGADTHEWLPRLARGLREALADDR